jgi:hypothetical protein
MAQPLDFPPVSVYHYKVIRKTPQMTLTRETVKEFFTESEWDLIYSLVVNNREFCEDEDGDSYEDYTNVASKINNLFAN